MINDMKENMFKSNEKMGHLSREMEVIKKNKKLYNLKF